MSIRPSRVLLVLLIPVLAYGAFKGVLYYNAKRTMDDIALAASNHADVRYGSISTEVRGAVTVGDIRIQPIGSDDVIEIDAVRVASDDPLFFIRGGHWTPGEDAPPGSLSFAVNGVRLPLSDAWLPPSPTGVTPADPLVGACANGLQINAALLRQLGFKTIAVDMDGSYRLDETARTLDLDLNTDMRDVQSMRFAATFTDVDVVAMGQGVPSGNLNLGRLSVAMRLSPEFGRQALKACASGSDQTVDAWSGILADRALEGLASAGLTLGSGLSDAVRTFYREWGEIRVVAAPEKPVGMLSLAFLPPEQLVDALSLQLSLNGRPLPDTRFTWQRPDGANLGKLFAGESEQADSKTEARSRRIIVRRKFESVRVGDMARYLEHEVQIKPRGLPVREGVLKRIRDGEAEVEQILHGGRYTAYVPIGQIESLRVLVQREVKPVQ